MTEDRFDVRNRYLIVIASGDYGEGSEWNNLPVENSASVWTNWLTAEALDDRRFDLLDPLLAKSPTRRTVIDDFVDTNRITAGDVLVVYVVGHGEVIDGSHWLALRGSVKDKKNSTMIETKNLIGLIRETQVDHALIVIDTCYAGAITGDMFRLDKDLKDGWLGFATTSPTKEAFLGVLANSLKAFLESPANGSDIQPYFNPWELLRLLRTELRKRNQPVVLFTALPADAPSPCLPNPRYDAASNLPVETESSRRDLAIRMEDLVSHWEPRSRGLQTSAESGWLFSGRERLMTELVRATRSTVGAVTMVTGNAGCGKSAVLSRLVTLSDPVFVGAHANEIGDLPGEFRPGVGAVDVAILATGRDSWQIVDQMHGALCPSDPARNQQWELPTQRQDAQLDEVVETLTDSDNPTCIVIDAVDEARNPHDLVSKALLPLVTRAGTKLNLILGVRSSGEPGVDYVSLADSAASLLHASVLRADAYPFWDRSDLVKYIDELLARSGSEKPSPYAANREISQATAEVLADLCGTSFVLGRVVAVELASRDTIQDPHDPEWRRRVGNGLAEVIRAELQRSFPDSADHARVLAVMGAPAMSFGRGLPWQRVWPTVATALGQEGKTYGDADIAAILGHRISGYLIRELDDTGATVYRPFHEAVRTALLENLPSDASTTHRATAIGLEALIPRAETARDIIEPETYVRRHLADHAAAGRMLDELLTRADIILTADPVYLAATLGGIQRRGANAAAVLRCLQHLQSGNPDEKAKQLALAALQSGADELAFRAGALAASASWRPLWAWWRPANASRVVGELPSAARALTALATEQGALAIAGGDFGIEVWDIGSGRRLAAHPGNVHSVAVGHVARRAMLLAGHDDGMVSLHELPNLEILAHNLSEHSRAVRAAVIVGRGSMAATGDDDGAVVLWQLPALKALAKEPRAHARVTDLAAAVLDGTSLLISAGDTFENGYRDHDTQPVRAWALPGLSLHAEVETKTSVSNFLKAVSSPLGCIVVFQKGSGFAVKLVAADGTVKLVGARDSGWLSDLLVLREGDEPEIALLFETLEPLTINLTPVPALTLGPYVEIEFAGHWAGPVVLNERVILLSGGRTLRVWDLYDLLAASSPHADISHLAERQKVHYVEAIASASEVLAVLTSDGSVHRWLWRSGEALEPPLVVRREPIEAMANCILAGRPHFAVGYRDGIVEAFDAESAERWPALVDVAAPLHAMAVGEQDGRTVAATAVQLGFDEGRPFYGVRLWDLMTGEEIPTQDSSMVAADRARAARGLPTNDMLHWELVVHGYADKKLDLAVVEKDDYLLIVAHTSLGLTVWPLDATGIGEELRVDSPADLGAIAGRQGLLAVGDSNGRWGLWCLDAAHAVQGEHRGLAALAVGKRQGAPVLLSGGADGWVRVWSRDGDQIQSIDTGEWITSLAFMADDHIAVGTRRGVVVVQLTNSSSDTLSAIG